MPLPVTAQSELNGRNETEWLGWGSEFIIDPGRSKSQTSRKETHKEGTFLEMFFPLWGFLFILWDVRLIHTKLTHLQIGLFRNPKEQERLQANHSLPEKPDLCILWRPVPVQSPLSRLQALLLLLGEVQFQHWLSKDHKVKNKGLNDCVGAHL